MTYRIDWAPRARKQVDHLQGKLAARVFEAVESLATDPRPSGSKKLVGTDQWRIRVGEYRIIYEIHDGHMLILVVRVAHRREVYR